MSGLEVEFVGGPLDGHQRIVPCADPCEDSLRPEPVYLCWTASAADTASVRHTYKLEVSPKDDGPLWLYQWAGEQR